MKLNSGRLLILIGSAAGLSGLAHGLGTVSPPVIAAPKNPFADLPEVTNYDGLEIGRSYYLVDQDDRVFPGIGTRKFISECKTSGMWEAGKPSKWFESRFWAMDDNPQAFRRWKIYGPISSDWIKTS